jgi:hypothetical protein
MAAVSFVVGGGELPKREISKSSGMKQLILVRNTSGRGAQETIVTEIIRLFDCTVAKAGSRGNASELYSGGGRFEWQQVYPLS